MIYKNILGNRDENVCTFIKIFILDLRDGDSDISDITDSNTEEIARGYMRYGDGRQSRSHLCIMRTAVTLAAVLACIAISHGYRPLRPQIKPLSPFKLQ